VRGPEPEGTDVYLLCSLNDTSTISPGFHRGSALVAEVEGEI
jgi:hypothetical protein